MATDNEQAPSPVLQFPEPSPHEEHSTVGRTDTTPEFSPLQIAEHERSAALSAKEQAGLDARAKLETDQAQINADKATKDLAIQDDLDKRKFAADELHANKIAKQAEVLRQANEAIKARPAPALFADRDGWSKTILAIGLAFAGLGDAMKAKAAARLGSANVGNMDAVGDIINADLDRQREAIKKLSDNQVIAKEGVKDALEARTLAMSRIDMLGAEMYKRANLHTQQLLAAKGVALPQIAKDEKVLDLQRKEQDRKDAAVAPLVEQHSKHVEKSVTDRTSTPKSGAGTPGVQFDSNGNPLPVDPNATTARGETAANAKTPLQGGLMDSLKELAKPSTPPSVKSLIPGNPNADYEVRKQHTDVARSQWMGAHSIPDTVDSRKEVEKVIPDPPGPLSTQGQRDAYDAKIRSALDMTDRMLKRTRGTGGVPFKIEQPAAPKAPGAPTVVRTGTNRQGQKVQQLSDGSIRVVQ